MIITDDFVFLNYPRTGSTFVREALRKAYSMYRERHFEELVLPIDRTRSARRQGRSSQHGSRQQVPAEHEGKLVLSVARHPLDRLVSQYGLEFWKKGHHIAPVAELCAHFPRYPELTFEEFLDYHGTYAFEDVRQDAELRADIGTETLQFVRFYAPDPEASIRTLTDDAIAEGVPGLIDGIRFLSIETLSADLRALLHEVGFPESATRFLDRKRRSNASRDRRGRSWNDYVTPPIEADFRKRERLLFRLFPQYDTSGA